MRSGLMGRCIAAWPAHMPMVAAWSGAGVRGFLGRPAGTFRVDRAAGGLRARWLDASGYETPAPVALVGDPLRDLAALLAWSRLATGGSGRWVGWLGYELGEVLEPAVRKDTPGPTGPDSVRRNGRRISLGPLLELHWCPDIVVPAACPQVTSDASRPGGTFVSPVLGAVRSTMGRAAYEQAVARCVAYLHAGDVFQANLSHRLVAPFRGSGRSAFAALCHVAKPRYGLYVESPGGEGPEGGAVRLVLSISPELFLRVRREADGDGLVVMTRPIKGTRPVWGNPRELAQHPKEQAELDMIIDLMRNDLGRVASPGSVRVVERRRIERYAGRFGVFHAVATVTARLRSEAGPCELIRAAFPPGSVTGAPKVRAMQIIRELEPDMRGAYCGCAGWIAPDGTMCLNVAIRTAEIVGEQGGKGVDHVREGVLEYGVGAGIVADSQPHAEWCETLHKAALLRALRAVRGQPAERYEA